MCKNPAGDSVPDPVSGADVPIIVNFPGYALDSLPAAYPNGLNYESIPEEFWTTVLMDTEDQLIERVRNTVPHLAGGLRVGIGDDAAVIVPRKGTEWVVTTDAFLENVHFLRKVHAPGVVGYKALARATSDVAAMGARPRYFFLSLAIPSTCTKSWLDGFLGGVAMAANQFGLTLAGGDTTKFPSVLVNLTVMGEVAAGRAVLRSGAKPGDLIFVSGRLGEAELGLELILKGLHRNRRWRGLLRKHVRPEPRLALGHWLADRGYASAMIDTSDGLSTDLGHVCKASGIGARVFAGKIPVVQVPPELQRKGFDPLRLAVNGGEDYELLFTVPKRLARRVPQDVTGVPVTSIGEITRGKEVVLVDSRGKTNAMRPGGWDPFKKGKVAK
jgi:thiamine-monophosphate kinase